MPGNFGLEPLPPPRGNEQSSADEYLPCTQDAVRLSPERGLLARLFPFGVALWFILPLGGFHGIVLAALLTPFLIWMAVERFHSDYHEVEINALRKVSLPFSEEQFLVRVHQDSLGQTTVSDSGFVTIVDDHVLFLGDYYHLRFSRDSIELDPNGVSMFTSKHGRFTVDTYFTPIGWIPAGATEVQVTYAELYNRLQAWKYKSAVPPRIGK